MITRKTTQELLYDSLHELVLKKSVEKISVTEITTNCGMTPAAFYRYFRDKYELLAWKHTKIQEDIYDDLLAGRVSWKEAVSQAINLLEKDRLFYRKALSGIEKQNAFFQSTNQLALEKMAAFAKDKMPEACDQEFEFDLRFYLMSASRAAIDWLIHSQGYTKEEIVEYIYNARPEKLKNFLI